MIPWWMEHWQHLNISSSTAVVLWVSDTLLPTVSSNRAASHWTQGSFCRVPWATDNSPDQPYWGLPAREQDLNSALSCQCLFKQCFQLLSTLGTACPCPRTLAHTPGSCLGGGAVLSLWACLEISGNLQTVSDPLASEPGLRLSPSPWPQLMDGDPGESCQLQGCPALGQGLWDGPCCPQLLSSPCLGSHLYLQTSYLPLLTYI